MEHLYYKLEIDSAKELWKSLNSLPYECSIMNAHTHIFCFIDFPTQFRCRLKTTLFYTDISSNTDISAKEKNEILNWKCALITKQATEQKRREKYLNKKKAHDHYECVLDLHYLRLAMNKYNRIIILSFLKTRRQFFFSLHTNDHGPSTRRTPSTRFWLTPYQVY